MYVTFILPFSCYSHSHWYPINTVKDLNHRSVTGALFPLTTLESHRCPVTSGRAVSIQNNLLLYPDGAVGIAFSIYSQCTCSFQRT